MCWNPEDKVLTPEALLAGLGGAIAYNSLELAKSGMASKQKSVLVATIGTRDLAYKTVDGVWLNLGDDRSYQERPSPMSRVIEELYAESKDPGQLDQATFRDLTKYLCDRWNHYGDRLIPIILGKLLEDEQRTLKSIYVVATNQPESVREREKDTLYAAQIFKHYVEQHYEIPVTVIEQGEDPRESPADFEAMFRWCKRDVWPAIAPGVSRGNPLLLCLKGGVNQTSEAIRVTALSCFGERTRFYDFKENWQGNQQGIPSDYTVPLRGTNYLWDRQQQAALGLLERYDYTAVQDLLDGYYRLARNGDVSEEILTVEQGLTPAIAWTICDFDSFAEGITQTSAPTPHWSWIAYEAAYLGDVRFRQHNILEAMFHSFRAVEGLMMTWALREFRQHIETSNRRQNRQDAPVLHSSICREFPGLTSQFQNTSRRALYGRLLDELFKEACGEHCQMNSDLWVFFEVAKPWRNSVFHRLLRLRPDELFTAWQVAGSREWRSRILGCLNAISGQEYQSLEESSHMVALHQHILEQISRYQP